MKKWRCMLFLLFWLSTDFYVVDAGGFMATIPRSFRPGSHFRVNVFKQSGSNSEGITVTLLRGLQNEISKNIHVTGGDLKTVTLCVPPSTKFSPDYKVLIRSASHRIQQNIKFDEKDTIVLIQTDRGMYAKNEVVKLKIVALNHDLTPYGGQTNVEIFDAKNKLVKQWLGGQGMLGVFSQEFRIPSDPNMGNWKIVAKTKREITEKTLIVRRYVLPKFKVDITCPRYYVSSNRVIACVVSARYTFGKKLKGTIQIQAVTVINNKEVHLEENNNNRRYYDNIYGRKKITIRWKPNTKVVSRIEFIAQVGDSSTGATVTNMVYIKPKESPSMRWTLEPWHVNFKPGLPFVTFMKFEDLKSSSVSVTVFTTAYRRKYCSFTFKYYTLKYTTSEVKTVVIDGSGYGKLNLSPPSNALILKIKTYHNSETKEVKLKAYPFKGEAMTIVPRNPFATVGLSYRFKVQTTSTVTPPLMYTIYSRKDIVESGTLSRSKNRKYSLQINTKPSYYPRFQLLVFYVDSNNYIRHDTINVVAVGSPTNNFVHLKFDKDKDPYEPGENVTITITSKPLSIVHILSVDEGIESSQSGYDISVNDVKQALAGYTSKAEFESGDISFHVTGSAIFNPRRTVILPDTCTDPCKNFRCKNGHKCRRTRNGPLCTCSGRSCLRIKPANAPGMFRMFSLSNSFRFFRHTFRRKFQNKRFRFRGRKGSRFGRRKKPPPVSVVRKSKQTLNLRKTKRLYFPKTWIWESIHLSSMTETIQRRVPDSLTTWVTSAFAVEKNHGFGILQRHKTVKVFRSFFIEVNVPNYIVTGGHAVFKITIFNFTPYKMEIILVSQFQEKSVKNIITSVPGQKKLKHVIFKAGKGGTSKVTVVAYDFFNFPQWIDWVQKTVTVKAPGIPQEYNIPHIITASSMTTKVKKHIKITTPSFVLRGSTSIYVTITGDILAPSIDGLGHLLRMPCGCGEQTMMFLAPNIYVLNYLKKTKQLTPALKSKAITNINRGIDNQLRWRRSDGSFSVWGNRDHRGSTWLTSFVVMCFYQAKQFVNVDDYIFDGAIEWLLNKQNYDGSFNEVGRVIHYQMQGGVRVSRATMTAYTLLSLMETSSIVKFKMKIKQAILRGTSYLSKTSTFYSIKRNTHAMALVCYALQRAKSHNNAKKIYTELRRRATTKGDFLYWVNSRNNKNYQAKLKWQPPNPRARPIDIETTSYVLHYLTEKRDGTSGMKIVNWLTSQRNPYGGFSSTQDTVVSLHALSRFATMLKKTKDNVKITVKTDSVQKSFHVTKNNRRLIQRLELEKTTKYVDFEICGHGLVLVDTIVKYNVLKNENPVFGITTKVDKKYQTFDDIRVHVCIERKNKENNGMVVAEVGVPCGFQGDISKTSAVGLQHKETDSESVILYFKNLYRKVCFNVAAGRIDKVTESEPIPIKVYDYYEPQNHGIGNYTSAKLREMSICDICADCDVCNDLVIG